MCGVKEFVVYTAARFAIFGVCVAGAIGIFWGIAAARGGGMADVPVLWALVLGAVVSVTLSAWLLRDLREQFAGRVQERAEQMVRRSDEREPGSPESGDR